MSFALDSVQARRARTYPVPGRSVHAYANLYFDAHNPTLSRIRESNGSLVVLRIDPSVLDIPGTIIATKNAGADGVRFLPSPQGLAELDEERVYATFWLHEDADVKREWGHAKCSEVLVPDVVPARHITGGYVCSVACQSALAGAVPSLGTQVHPALFF